MSGLRQRRFRFTTWLAILAVLAQALVPFVARAADGFRDFAPEICLPGAAIAQENPDGSPVPVVPSTHQIDCAYCLTHAGGTALLPPAAPVLPQAQRFAVVAPQANLPFRSRSAWATAQPRAPPALS